MLGFIGSVGAITGSEAVEASKAATEVQTLLSENPSKSYALVSSAEWKGTECWKVMWWTDDQLKAGLNYPNVVVYVQKNDGRIIQVLIPRGSEQGYSLPDKVTLQASRNTVHLDLREQVILSGQISPPVTTTVILEYDTPETGWRLLATTTSKEDGSYSYLWVPPVGNYQVRSRILSTTSGIVRVYVVPEFNGMALSETLILASALMLVVLMLHRQRNVVARQDSRRTVVPVA
jgi:hypothetical protein